MRRFSSQISPPVLFASEASFLFGQHSSMLLALAIVAAPPSYMLIFIDVKLNIPLIVFGPC
jgi:hypothetical protein